MKFKDIPTIQRRNSSVDQRIAWSGALSAPGRTVHRRRRIRKSDVIGFLIMLLVLLACSWEGVLTWLTR
jgi:hypothetical protein